jgi:senataxin
MNKFELPELDTLYYNICSWDYYKDLVEENIVTNHIEEDVVWQEIHESETTTKESSIQAKPKEGLEKIPLKFNNSEEYIKIWMNLFLFESKSQISRAKIIEKEDTEKFTLNFVKFDEKKKFFVFELVRQVSRGVNYSNGDLILIHKYPINEEGQKEHTIGVVDKFIFTGNILITRIVLIQNERSIAFSNHISKNSEWYVTRICNLATIAREYQALLSVENLKILDLLLHPETIYTEKVVNPQDYFFMPKRLENKLRKYFNSSQIDALRNSIKKRGLTLIQGPPGTGKSTTILGILSVILNSLIKKEGPERKNSILNMVNQEILYEDNKLSSNHQTNQESQKYSQLNHPWLYSDVTTEEESEKGGYHFNNSTHNFDDLGFSIDEVFGFTEYLTSKTTDNYKLLSRPLDEDVMPPEKILVCAPSNVAIDEIIRKMINSGLLDSEGNTFHPKFVRIGPNFNPNLKEYSLDYMVNQRLGISENFNMGGSASNMAKDIEKVKFEILSSVKIVCSTLSMAGSNILTSLNQKFDTVVIDEAAQAIETSTLIPLKYNCERLILVGDPKQLAATVFSRTALKYNYDQSLFKRFQEAGYEVTVLKTQYRMHKIISKFISDTFYDGLLEDDKDIADSTENEACLSHPAFQPLTFYDLESEEDFINNSFYNEGQVHVIIELIKNLKTIYSSPAEIIEKVAIISPYSNQVLRIKDSISKIEGFSKENCVEVNTVDGFQGKEKSIIIFSTVRSKGSKTIGFLSDERRMNVGLSRAKSSLIVIGDSKKLIQDSNWEKLLKYSFKNATFYKIKGKVKEYFKDFETNCKKFQVTNEDSFVKMIYTSSNK